MIKDENELKLLHMQCTNLFRTGNSLGMVIPARVLGLMKVDEDDDIIMEVWIEAGEVKITLKKGC